jgi:membrane protease subunit HflC
VKEGGVQVKTGYIFGILGLLALGAITLFSAAYTVAENEQVIITEFGRPVGGPVTQAGLHWRTPFVQTVHRFEKRLLEYNGDPDAGQEVHPH